MKINIFYTILAVFAISFSSCTDWLNETNPNLTDKDSYWRNLNETDATLNAAYSTLWSDYVTNSGMEAPRSDLATPGWGRPGYTGNLTSPFHYHTYTSSTKHIYSKWSVLYNGIFRTNQVIEALQRLGDQENPERWVQQMAQARFLRGMYHFYLHSTFNQGKIVIANKVPGTYDEMLKSLSPSKDVIDFFRKDLIYAYNNLPEVWNDPASLGRATKGAAATLLGNSLLFEATQNHVGDVNLTLIDSAVVMYNSVVDSKVYQLEEDMTKLFTTAGEFNKESIFEISYDNTIDDEMVKWAEDRPTNKFAFRFNGRGSNPDNVYPSLWITYAYLNETLDSKDPRNEVQKVLSETKSETIQRPVSLRASAMVALIQDEYTPYYQGLMHNRLSFESGAKAGKNGFSRYKVFINHDIVENELDLPDIQKSGKNVTLNRLAEVYLNLAECHIYRGEVDEAIELINKIRRRWALQNIGLSKGDVSHDYDEVDYTASTLLERLQMVEKPLETSVEGHAIRWIDLRRWGLLSGANNIFDQHAAKTWYSANYTVSQGEIKGSAKKFCCTITDVQDPSDKNAIEMTDFGQSALGFDYDTHAWWPIPSTEQLANPNL